MRQTNYLQPISKFKVSPFHTDNTRKPLFVLFIATLTASVLVLFALNNSPDIAILLVDSLFCLFCVNSFKHRLRYLFLLHPFMVWLLSQFYVTPFIFLGGGDVYFNVVKYYTPLLQNNIEQIVGILLAGEIKSLYLGIYPNILIPQYLYGTPSSTTYFYWQSCFHTFLVVICLVLSKQWNTTKEDYLFFIILFSIISPSFFELGNAPTRHNFTYFSVLLFYISFSAIIQSVSIHKLLWLFIAIAGVTISKTVYFVPILAYSFIILLIIHKKSISKTKLVLFLIAIITSTSGAYSYFAEQSEIYIEISQQGANTFGYLANTPYLTIVMKYMFALLSPFPWQKANIYIPTIYGGNILHFIMHILSSLTGIYFFTRIILRIRPLLNLHKDLLPLLLYGLIMSTSIIGGATGFHSYLLIFFPFFAPILAIKQHGIPLILPIITVIVIESIYTIALTV